MTEEHLARTCTQLQQSQRLRGQIDCLFPPTEDGNLNYWRVKWRDESREDYAVVHSDGRHIGNCGLCDIDKERAKAQLWIYLWESHGTGNGSTAMRLLLTRAFDELVLNRVYLLVLADNISAINFYEKHGFVKEGVLRQDTRHGDRYIDSFLMSMLADEYKSATRKAAAMI